MFFLADTTQKVDNNHRAIRFAYSCISSVIRFRFSKNAAIRLRIVVNAICFSSLLLKKPRFQAKVPSIDLVSNQVYHGIDGILLASSKNG